LGARQKLNNVNVLGALGAAGLIGLLAQSWIVFTIVGVALIAAGLHSGDIRPTKDKRL